jgi:hypothetical protein
MPPSLFTYHVMRGEMINNADDDTRCHVMEHVLRQYFDIRPILRNAIKEAFFRMKLNEQLIRTRCSEIGESLHRLRQMRTMPASEFSATKDAQDIAAYRLLVAI